MPTLRPRVLTAADAAMDPGVKEDSYIAKVVHYIPSEIIAAYLAASGVLTGSSSHRQAMLWVIFGILMILTPLWILYATALPDKPVPIFQAFAAMLGFAVWIFAIGGPFAYLSWYRPEYGSLVLIFSTLSIPIMEKLFVRASPEG